MEFFKNFASSPFLRGLSAGKKTALIALMTSFSVVSNMFFEFRFFDVQFSVTIATSCFVGIITGPLIGFLSCFVGDLIGVIADGNIYMPWVGISTAMTALIAGVIFNKEPETPLKTALMTAIFSITTFIVCTVAINSTGFYLYNRAMGFSDSVLSYVEEKFGTDGVGYFAYLMYRLIFKGQILNSLFNYFLLIVLLPVFKKIKLVKS